MIFFSPSCHGPRSRARSAALRKQESEDEDVFVNPLAYMDPIIDNPPPSDSFDRRRRSAQHGWQAANASGGVGGLAGHRKSTSSASVEDAISKSGEVEEAGGGRGVGNGEGGGVSSGGDGRGSSPAAFKALQAGKVRVLLLHAFIVAAKTIATTKCSKSQMVVYVRGFV